ncbi:diacylglycerol kinase delta-like isoform X2 [Tachypleus tridentatus]|uniref:diacylglycerol kinase delta-like isoform X2 n=1 Tax=Tachypleus tridentatus TaxID=6853 RepID=UPI003FD41F23
MATGLGTAGSVSEKCGSDVPSEDSSESEGDGEPSKSFHRRISTSKAIKNGRWKRRYFKLNPRKLYYAKDSKSVIFEEVDLTDLSIAECSTKNVNHSFQLITPFRRLILCAESRKEMESWISALKSVGNKNFYEGAENPDFMSGQHHWFVTSHARPTYCNLCREALSGVTSRGLSCEVCKFKVHKKCAIKALNNCKWTTLATIGRDIIEDEDRNLAMPHQWLEGNLPVSAKCSVCDKTCGSVLRLQDWRCLWCRAMVHSACKASFPKRCPLGICHVSVVPPIALHSIGTDDAWEATRPVGCSPLLVFVNSKSGDNQGVKFLRRFKQLLNPAQVFDLMNTGPGLGLRMFQTFHPFRVLVCAGDGSVSWVLAEIDKLNLHNQCQLGVLPLGTGNDLARVLGWGSVCDDDTQLPQQLEKYEVATTRLLDRWSIMTYERTVLEPETKKVSSPEFDPMSVEDSVVTHLTQILHSDQHSVVISSAKVLCETVKDFIAKVGIAYAQEGSHVDDSITQKCAVLNEKLDSLLKTLEEESIATSSSPEKVMSDVTVSHEKEVEKGEREVTEKGEKSAHPKKKKTVFIRREALMSRANSLKKAVRQIIEHTEKAVDEQNAQTEERKSPVIETDTCDIRVDSSIEETVEPQGKWDIPVFTTTFHSDDTSSSQLSSSPCWNPWGSSMGQSVGAALKNTLQVTLPTIEGGISADSSPCPSPRSFDLLTPSPLRSPCPSPSSQQTHSPSPSTGELSIPLRGISPLSISPLPTDTECEEKDDDFMTPEIRIEAERSSSPTASRRISSGSTFKHVGNIGIHWGVGVGLPLLPSVVREKSRSPETVPVENREFPIINPLTSLPMWPNLNKDSLIGKVLLANADALCAAASPLMDIEEMSLEEYEEKCVMNNYFGIGLDAKITLEFHNKREEHPEKCRSRTKNLMWYGVLGGKELWQRSFRNLEQKVQLECDGRRIPLPSLQGIVVLNIPSYGGGSNFWGGTKEDDVFYAPAFDDKILEVVAVFGTVQMAASRVMNLQHHRIAQCRSVKISIIGDEGVPVQVDGEAWIQPPGYICIVHKNRTQVLCRNRHSESIQKIWQEKQRYAGSLRTLHLVPISEDEAQCLTSFVETAASFVRNVKVASISHPLVEQDLFPYASHVACCMDRIFPGGRMVEGPNLRQQVSDLVHSVRKLYHETSKFLQEKSEEAHVRADLEERLSSTLAAMRSELKKCTEIQGVVHFFGNKEELVPGQKQHHGHHRGLHFKLKFKKSAKSSKQEHHGASSKCGGKACGMQTESSGKSCGTPVESSESELPPVVWSWSAEEVALWLESLQMGEYGESFIKHDIQGPELLSLERRDLKDLGVNKVGHIKRILQAIKDITPYIQTKKFS